ncbi:MAG: hypothetical protein UY49_C0002G0007 [Microgenomates group bacterium GW2011_GWC1_49_7]|nr:MAG: hypothetical protein UY49_C0002G0007 [Microgenomates group bacterium GW2011_GWC1_49_7]
MLTQNDIAEIERIVGDKIDEKTKLLPTKNEYFQRMDGLSGQIKKLQETMDLHDGQHTEIHDHEHDITERMETVEKKLGIKHSISPAI